MKEEMMEDAMDDAFADDEDEVRAARSPTHARLVRPVVRLLRKPETMPRVPSRHLTRPACGARRAPG